MNPGMNQTVTFSKRILKRLIGRCLKSAINDPLVLVMVDGGVCSQMMQYTLGKIFRERGHHVKYDLSFYTTSASRNPLRNFDLLTAFPHLQFPVASQTEVALYKRYFYHAGITPEQRQAFAYARPPIYLGGYYDHAPLLADMEESLLRDFEFRNLALDLSNQAFLQLISESEHSVGVHVRRGDMANGGAYYDALGPEYFLGAITVMQQSVGKPKLFFFSDEMDWVKTCLLPKLPPGIDYETAGFNGEDKGYLDLFLLSKCKHQIASQSSFGKIAAFLNRNPGKLVLVDTKTNLVRKRWHWLKELDKRGNVIQT